MRACHKGHCDWYVNGECRVCTHEWQRTYRARRKAAMEFAKQFERAGPA